LGLHRCKRRTGMPTTKVLSLVGLILVSALLWSWAHAEMLKPDDELTVFYEVAGAGQVPIVFIPG